MARVFYDFESRYNVSSSSLFDNEHNKKFKTFAVISEKYEALMIDPELDKPEIGSDR